MTVETWKAEYDVEPNAAVATGYHERTVTFEHDDLDAIDLWITTQIMQGYCKRENVRRFSVITTEIFVE